ncbi:PhnB protein [Microbacterium ginsengiterrae]|uniref:PhnB protein n=1 Tax=Microbacterium ginsengiterrae TaxID=546115 RepID=A0A7W9FAH3_9MICO|nr:VOC family protein [Microbacterium ginsengiterrae]MBB5742122.1 PhnB protein [Microbacterium ginsengiterrae]
MSGLVPYLSFPGNAAEALTFYRDVFGGTLELFSYEQFGRTDGPADAIAHGALSGPVQLFASDAAGDEDAVHMVGVSFSLLGAADPQTLQAWFAALAEGGMIIDPLQERPWGDTDGQVADRYGIRWLIGHSQS